MQKRSRHGIFSLLFLFAFAPSLFAADSAEQLISDAWKAIAEHKLALAEQKFLAASDSASVGSRPFFGLSFIYGLQKNNERAFEFFSKGVEKEPNPYPFYSAEWVTEKMRDFTNPKTIARLELLAKQGDELGSLRAMSHEILGAYYESKGKFSKAKEHYSAMNAIGDWKIIGMFDNLSGSGLRKIYPPETEFNPVASYIAQDGAPATWMPIAALRNDFWIDYERYYSSIQSVFYANTFVYSPKKQTIHFRIGTSGAFRAFLNDELIGEDSSETNNDLDTYIYKTELQSGWNRILIKSAAWDINRCNFMLRLTDFSGNPLPDIRISSEVQEYAKKPKSTSTFIPIFAIDFFKKRLEENPTAIENYLFLADMYLRNDRSSEAEEVLENALSILPDCPLIQFRLLEAYRRDKQTDKIETMVDAIFKTATDIPDILSYKISEAYSNKDLEKAGELVAKYLELRAGTADAFEIGIQYYFKKNLIEKGAELNRQALEKFPNNYDFSVVEATLSYQNTRKYDKGIEIFERFTENSTNPNGIYYLAQMYLNSSNLKKWRTTMDRLFLLSPASPGYYYQMALTYSTIQENKTALEFLRKAIQICPTNTNYWTKMGEIFRTNGELDSAKNAYRQALTYYPSNYSAREVLRDLEGKRNIFSAFPASNADSLIRTAPSADKFPDSPAIILLNDTKRVVYEQGVSETSQELAAKVFNARGVDIFKEYNIPAFSYGEEVIIEKAVVIKPDGTEIKADVDKTQIVFKSLEENNIIYVKWKTRSYYAGSLAGHFWDTHYFNSFLPMQQVRYSLLAPKNKKFNFDARNFPAEPTKSATDDGTLYVWSSSNEPALESEYGMPNYDDVGKTLIISNINDWSEIVHWYVDATTNKTYSARIIQRAVAELLNGNTSFSNDEKIQLVYNYITENIRYSFVSFRQSGLIPQKAADVLENRIGDCKDVATLCIAMLKELGITAHYVLVNTRDEGQVKNSLPSMSFNHCIVGVERPSGTLYLDLTANNFPLGSVPDPDIEASSLLIKSGVKKLETLNKERFLPRVIIRQSTVEFLPDNGIAVEKITTRTGSIGALSRMYYRDKSKKEQEKQLTESLTRDFPGVKLTLLELDDLTTITPALTMRTKYTIPDYISEAGSSLFLKAPWSDKLEPDEAFSYDERTFPIESLPTADTLRETLNIIIPNDYEPVELPAKVHFSTPQQDYTVTWNFSGNTITGKRVLVYKSSLIMPAEYATARKQYSSMVREDARNILLKKREEKAQKKKKK